VSGKVYAWANSNGAEVAENMRFATQTPAPALQGKVVAALYANTVFLARTDADELFWWNATASGYVSGLAGREIVSIAAGGNSPLVVVVPLLEDLEVASPATIAGTPEVGSTLTGTPATFNATDGVTLSNQWLADGSEIASATGTTLVLTGAQLGKEITFRTTAVRGGETVPSTSAAVGPVTEPVPALEVDDPPTIAGTPKVGSTLTGTPATFNATDGVTLSNQWLADGAEIAGATGTTFVLTGAQLGKQITFRTTAVRGGEAVPSTSTPVGPVTTPVPDLAVAANPTIAGTPQVGSTLTGTPATFNATDGVTVTNEWLVNGEVIAGATGTTLALTSAHAGKTIAFRTTAVRGAETVSSTSAAVGPVAAPQVGPTPECLAAQAAAGAAQAALGGAQAKVVKAKAKLKKAKKAKKPAAKVKKLKAKLKKAKQAQKAASSALATASANVTAKCS
jgi:hypothetical protein